MASLKRLLIGSPMETKRLKHEKLPKWKALAVFSSDALSSVAYATEEILLVLMLFGTSVFFYSLPIALAILGLLLIVTLSYRQIIYAFPSGGGAYVVARDHLSTTTSLVAGAALMIDYILTVAVSISSGVAALTSAFPSLLPWKVEIAIALVLLLMILNLRGITESATVFAYPTYLFIISVLVLIAVGGWQLWHEGWHGFNYKEHASAEHFFTSGYGMFILLRAFASGCSAMTGVEAISNGVPAFKPDSSKNAAITMGWMSLLLGTMFLGITILAAGFGVTPMEHKTVISQIGHHVFGNSVFFYLFQMITMLILILAANTSFAGFPQLVSIIANDRFLPRSLAARGDRLVFSNGIILLSALSILLIVVFQGETHSLIPLYAVGVFLSFTIGQSGMIKKIWKEKEKKNIATLATIMTGTFVTGLVTVITILAKFTQGAWLVIVAIPLLVIMFYKVRHHYEKLGQQLKLDEKEWREREKIVKPKVIIPISGVSKVVAQSVQYARSISNDITAISIIFHEEEEQKLRAKWEKFYPDIELKVIYSPYRTILSPLLDYINDVEKETKGSPITVLMPQFIVKKWWHALLHNQTAIVLRFFLTIKKDVVVATLPYHLKE
ncbi:amino acid/polyamine/organocation transporter (APC superfamily) [Thermolongibacillus altinsuensis]|uniref:Amino acid/polyamine/organocation transporter (APC superfamily) n=1 Tax=Thermolongibacillus altinsuensis TaxID=575256 RepID=A0A4R1QQ26_9BACL|nr:APC family permease [Thermolongibacillus altinsuensis]TCL50995.1 amino acid/polyamine/organocation transporter (APC superfamily) [Thermolongibacillus altinsuensis]GMB08935.1 putative amino acid permease YdaO [Thermolongibacillus altinsuensis]